MTDLASSAGRFPEPTYFTEIHSALCSGRLNDAVRALNEAFRAARRGQFIGADLLCEPRSYASVAALPAELGEALAERIELYNVLAERPEGYVLSAREMEDR